MIDFFEYNGNQYPYKTIYFHTDSCYYIIATDDLENVLLPDGENYDSEFARKIDEQIFFFVPNEIFNFSDNKIEQFVGKAL